MVKSRPWTVYALVALGAFGFAGALFLDAELTGWDFVTLGMNVIFVWGLWTGRPWAFSMSFMFASLCLALTLTAAFVQAFLMEMDVMTGLLWAAPVAALWITLLLLPSTKRYAGLNEPREPVSTST